MRRTSAFGKLRLRGDRGSATAETVVAMPLLILLLVQFGVWAHAVHVAQATAAEALSTARLENSTAADGQARALDVRAQIGPNALANSSVTVTRTADTVTVRLTGTAPRVMPLPFLRLPISAQASGPVERFRPDTARATAAR
jgi:hypothetical protein